MNKIIGFSVTRAPTKAVLPPWLHKYPQLKTSQLSRNGWNICFWGHGDFAEFATSQGFVVGYSDTELKVLSYTPLQNRGVLISTSPNRVTITNDAFGMLPVFYGSSQGIPHISSCEECVMIGIGKVTLGSARLVSYLLHRSAVGTATLWNEIDKLYANRVLISTVTGGFTQKNQDPLQPVSIPPNKAISIMANLHKRVIRRYTDLLGDVYLPLSCGHDSRLILTNMARPERIHARTYTSSWPYSRSQEILIARASAERVGVADHSILDFVGQTYAPYCRPQLEYAGTPLTNIQAYLYGAAAMMGREGNYDWPVISGSCGDILAGVGVVHVLDKLRLGLPPHLQFRMACHNRGSHSWSNKALSHGLAFNHQAAIERLYPMWADLWHATEFKEPTARCDLIRVRNRGSQYIAYAWAATDLWNGYVAPFTDREYITTMLSMPVPIRHSRSGQLQYMHQYFPKVFPNAGVSCTAYDISNTLNKTSVCADAVWPLLADGSKPAHNFFRPTEISAMHYRGLTGDMESFFWLRSLQPIAWAIDKGYVK